MIISSSTIAETYKLTVVSEHLDKNQVVVKNSEGDVIPTCVLPEILNEAKNACVNPVPQCTFTDVLNSTEDGCVNTFDKVGWIDRTDSCQGVRPISNNSNVLVLRANTPNRINSPIIPEGYRWITYQEYQSLVPQTTTYNYHGHCGHANYPSSNSQPQYEINFSNSSSTGFRSHAGFHEGLVDGFNSPNNSLGIIVVRDN